MVGGARAPRLRVVFWEQLPFSKGSWRRTRQSMEPSGAVRRWRLLQELPGSRFASEVSLSGCLATLDLTDIALQQFGERGAISALLGAVAGRLVGLRRESICEAIARELTDLGLVTTVIERNQAVAL